MKTPICKFCYPTNAFQLLLNRTLFLYLTGIILIIGLLLTSHSIFADDFKSPDTQPFIEVVIPQSANISLVSEITARNYELHVSLPAGYAKSDAAYPVVYLLDGNTDFPLVTAIARRLQKEGDMKEFIIVGLSYKDKAWYHRRGDYTLAKESGEGWEHSGGADKFALALEKELIPTIEKNFRTTKDRSLLGHSLGGLFGATLLIKQVPLFSNYIISSSSTWYENYALLNITVSENQPRELQQNKISVYLTVGALESPHMIKSWQLLSDYIDSNFKKVNMKTSSLENENHASAKFRAYSDGLRWIFK